MNTDGSDSDHSVTLLFDRLKAEDPDAARQIWQRYFDRLLPLARAKLRGRSDGAADEEDLLISVFERFFRAVKEDRFARLLDRDDLWQILLMLTERKVADLHRRATAAKRGGNVARSANPATDGDGVAELADCAPGPEFVAAFNDSLARAISRLTNDKSREVALLRMEGYENREIAERLGISLSSVERKLRVIREVWQEEFAIGAAQ